MAPCYGRAMNTTARPLLMLFALFCLAAVSGCGAGGGATDSSIAEVGTTPITRAALDHWMASIVGSDYFTHVGSRAPTGLVSDPPNYERCATAARQISPKRPGSQAVVSAEQLASYCHQLYQAIKQQALSVLIAFARRDREGAEQGVDPSEAEIDRVEAQQFPRRGELQAYLAERDWTPSDEIAALKHEVTSTRLLEKFRRQHPGGDWEQELGASFKAHTKKWAAETSCRPGYVVSECKQPTVAKTNPGLSAAILLEDLARH